MKKVRTIVLTGYGINCEEEVAFAFDKAGSSVDIVHINDIIAGLKKLADYQILTIPGGFSYGDDTGAGNAYANKLRNHLENELREFFKKEKLILGICNGCQILANLGLIPAVDSKYFEVQVNFRYNSTCRYEDRWIDLKNCSKKCVFTKGIDLMHLPVAHGEGNFYAEPQTLEKLALSDQIVFRYVKPNGFEANGEFPYNPNGSLQDIAGICDGTGRIMGLMPHPDRHLHFTNSDQWPLIKEMSFRAGRKLSEEGPGMQIFRNAVEWIKKNY